MSTARDPDGRFSAWLEEGPTDLPATTRDAITDAARSIPQAHPSFGLPRRTKMVRLVALAAAVLVVAVAGLSASSFLGTPGAGGEVSTPSATPGSSPEATDAPTWSTYTSRQYGHTVGSPAGWTVEPATRGWTFEQDAGESIVTTPGADHFTSPAPPVRVSSWAVPLDSGVRLETTQAIVAWVEDYCRRTGNTGCDEIADRAVPMCLERRDCHPAVVVPFASDVQAFFTGGIYDAASMNVVAVWRPETHPSVAPYGGARALLEAFLATMEVYPAP